MNWLLLLLVLVVYVPGVVTFWRGFNRTNFSGGRVYLSLLWPVFFIANKSYRQNFNRALKG